MMKLKLRKFYKYVIGGIDKEYFIRYKGLGPEYDSWILDRDIDAPLLIDEFNAALKQQKLNNRNYNNLRRGPKSKTVNIVKRVRFQNEDKSIQDNTIPTLKPTPIIKCVRFNDNITYS